MAQPTITLPLGRIILVDPYRRMTDKGIVTEHKYLARPTVGPACTFAVLAHAEDWILRSKPKGGR